MRYLVFMFSAVVALTTALVLNESAFADVSDVSSGAVNWIAPTAYENGDALAAADIGGYEVRYKKKTDAQYVRVVVPDRTAKSYVLTGLAAAQYEVSVAAYDKYGTYSAFAPIPLTIVSATPKAPSGVTAKQTVIDVVKACLAAAPACRVAVAGEWQ